jgi:SpoVK/Ycf46/Vps4 family AAA+-type ATPase
LLNVLDGFAAPTGVLFVMTTNHVEKLDPALLRPGRIDYKLYLGKASDRQKVELYRRFFPESTEAAAWQFVEASGSAETMAEFQGLLLSLEVKSFARQVDDSICSDALPRRKLESSDSKSRNLGVDLSPVVKTRVPSDSESRRFESCHGLRAM